MEVTKAKAAQILGLSPAEVVRRVKAGELKGRKKTANIYSDWVIEVPEGLSNLTVAKQVTSQLDAAELTAKAEESKPEESNQGALKPEEVNASQEPINQSRAEEKVKEEKPKIPQYRHWPRKVSFTRKGEERKEGKKVDDTSKRETDHGRDEPRVSKTEADKKVDKEEPKWWF